MIHAPHRDKKRDTSRSMSEEHGMDPTKVVVEDHDNEETVAETLQRGSWAAFPIYPSTKMGNARMVEILKPYGGERIIVDSACDWGTSDPLDSGLAGLARMPFGRFQAALACGALPLGFTAAGIGHLGADAPLLAMAVSAGIPLALWPLAHRLVAASPGGRAALAGRGGTNDAEERSLHRP